VAGLLALWFESRLHSLILVGSFDQWTLAALLGAIATAGAAIILLSLAYQVASWRGRLGTISAVLIVVATGAGTLFLGGWIVLVAVLSTSTVYARMTPHYDGKQVVVGVITAFHPQFQTYVGNGLLFDVAPSRSSEEVSDPVTIRRWVVDQGAGHYIVRYATSPHGALTTVTDLKWRPTS
jgi:hypothetical protein